MNKRRLVFLLILLSLVVACSAEPTPTPMPMPTPTLPPSPTPVPTQPPPATATPVPSPIPVTATIARTLTPTRATTATRTRTPTAKASAAATPAPGRVLSGKIAYSGREGKIYLREANGANSHVVASGRLLSLSLDGTKLLFANSENREDSGLWYLDLASGQRTLVLKLGVESANFLVSASFSPDMQRIAHDGDGDISVWDRGVNRRFSQGNEPAWSPDDGWIAYTRYIPNLIVKMSPNGGNEIQVVGGGRAPAWSPDGKKLAYLVGSNRPEIWAVNGDGGAPHRVLAADFGIISPYPPTWSPDGRYLAFIAVRDGMSQIFVANADGSNPASIAHTDPGNKEPWYRVRWSR